MHLCTEIALKHIYVLLFHCIMPFRDLICKPGARVYVCESLTTSSFNLLCLTFLYKKYILFFQDYGWVPSFVDTLMQGTDSLKCDETQVCLLALTIVDPQGVSTYFITFLSNNVNASSPSEVLIIIKPIV